MTRKSVSDCHWVTRQLEVRPVSQNASAGRKLVRPVWGTHLHIGIHKLRHASCCGGDWPGLLTSRRALSWVPAAVLHIIVLNLQAWKACAPHQVAASGQVGFALHVIPLMSYGVSTTN